MGQFIDTDEKIDTRVDNKWNTNGKMYAGGVTDNKFPSSEIITWENTVTQSMQWFGWQDAVFAKKKLRVSFWMKFVGQVPEKKWNTGLKVNGSSFLYEGIFIRILTNIFVPSPLPLPTPQRKSIFTIIIV